MSLIRIADHFILRTSREQQNKPEREKNMATSGTNGIKNTGFDPTKYPPFPDNVPSVKLETFSLAQLEKGDEALEERLFQTCKERGFFYLDFHDSAVSSMQEDGDAIARLAEKVFNLPEEEKEQYPMKDSLFG